MIKFDKDVLGVLKTLEKEGFETYAAGECVRTVIMGEQTYDWDLITRAELSDMQRLFPQGKIIGKKKQVFRLDFTYEVPSEEDDEPAVLEGSILDVRHFEGDVETVLAGNMFTLDAMADNPDRSFVDPFGGRNDIKEKLVRTTADADALFKEKPEAMMTAVRIAAETGFDLHKSVFDAMDNWRLLLKKMETEGPGTVRMELERILTSDNAGKGLKMLAGTGLIAVVLGEDVAGKLSMSDTRSFNTLCDNIDKTRPVRERRLGLLYTAIAKKRALPAIERMEFDEKTKTHLIDGVEKIIDINFLNTDKEFKRFLHKMGKERYMYLHNLGKAVRIVYDQPTMKVESRNYMLGKITGSGEPVFAEDLVIDANDLLEAGIVETPEQAEEVLNLVVALVHKNPKNNHRDVLLKYSRKYAKNKLAAKLRYVNWLR